MSEFVSTTYKGKLDLKDKIPLKTPYVVYIEPSGFCNFKCKFCHQYVEQEKMKELASLMNFQTFKKLVSDLQKFESKIKLVRICGQGEPLLNKKLGQYIKYMYESGVTEKIELITNGVLLKGDIIECISQYVTRIVVSVEALDGPGYQDLVGSDVKFEEIVNNIEEMYKNRKQCIVHIKIPNVSVPSEEDKKKFFDIFDKISDEMNIENIVPLWPEMNISKELTPILDKKSRWNKNLGEKKVCVQIFKGLQVCSDGDVVPCCVDWERINLLGNINAEPLEQIWLGRQLKELQNEHLCGNKEKIRPCAGCTMNDYSEPDNIDCLLNKMEIK